MNLRELDELVAEKVMGWNREEHLGLKRLIWKPADAPDTTWFNEQPHYSTDIAAAWEILEKMKKTNDWLRLDWIKFKGDTEESWSFGPVEICGDEEYIKDSLSCKTPSLAICVAALKSVGINVSKRDLE